jgi:hypothetical protein
MSDLFTGIIDSLWITSQRYRIQDLREQLEQLRSQHDLANWDLPKLKDVAAENLELRLRLGLLVRLLITKGVFSAEEYASLIASAHPAPKTAPPAST